MPFLIPAIVALSCDVVTLLLSRLAPFDPLYKNSEIEWTWVYRVGYLQSLAILRLIILLIPLLFHSYTGTAIRRPTFYQLLYYATTAGILLHIVFLCLLNPTSMESLLPLESVYDKHALMQHLHELRRDWWMLILSLVANFCHIFLFGHVRSTAPQEDWLRRRQKVPSAYYTVRQANNGIPDCIGYGDSIISIDWGGSAMSSNSRASNSHLPPAMNDFMNQLQGRLQQAKTDWTARIDDFTSRVSLANPTRSTSSYGNPLAPLTPFRVLCLLFGHEDVLDNGKLDAAYETDDGVTLTFFVPQLLSFLLHGALYSSPQLEEWILDTCRRNVYFAHRCYWFLRAWCLEVPVNSPPTPSILSRNNSDSAFAVIGGPAFLDEPDPSQRAMSPTKAYDCVGGNFRRDNAVKVQALKAQPHTNNGNDKFLPEERALIERLMMRVKECGEAAAKTLEFGTTTDRTISESGQEYYDTTDIDTSLIPKTPFGSSQSLGVEIQHHHRSPSEVMSAVESGKIPINPINGSPSVRHLDCLSSDRQFGFLPLDLPNSQHSPTRAARMPTHSETDCFDHTPQFLDSLVYIADNLFSVPREKRRDELRRQLRALECELLPSNSIYIPVNNAHHRVWRIVAEESITLNTKERVPCIVCMEVVDFSEVKRQAKTWNITRQGIRRTVSDNLTPSQQFNNQLATSVSLSIDSAEKADDSTLYKWRFNQRDPLRRVSIIDKMATTVKDTVKGPLDKMKNHLNQFKDRSISDELQSLTMNESEPEVVHNVASFESDLPKVQSDVGRHKKDDDSDNTSDFRSLSRTSSSSSFVSMGQWSSPHPSAIADSRDRSDKYTNGKARLQDVTRRLDIEKGSSMYGSDEEQNFARKKDPPVDSSGLDSLTSPESVATVSSVPTKPPQVVFKESWKNKIERLRSKSAYGDHIGWRLLPILIKANDDLRQEQLAAQLIHRMALVLAREKVPVWLCPYEVIALTDRGGVVECVPDTISLDSLKKNDASYTTLRNFFTSHFGDETEELADAKANFVESLAAYSVVCFLLQLKDRHNGNILLDAQGHIVHIDFGFFFLSSPGKNAGFESAPFKLTREFVDLLDGPNSRLFRVFRDLCIRTFIALRRHCMEIILLVEMIKVGNEELQCFRGRPDHAIQQLKERFRLDLNDRACREYVNSLIDDSIENWRTDWYDRYQRYFVGVL